MRAMMQRASSYGHLWQVAARWMLLAVLLFLASAAPLPVRAIGTDGLSPMRGPQETPNRGISTVPGDEHWANSFILNGTTGAVSAIAVSGSRVYAGGNFPTAGGIIANNVAAWNASSNTWEALGGGVTGGGSYPYIPLVSALAVDPNGNVFAGGTFTAADNLPANYVAKWNASTHQWSALGSGVEGCGGSGWCVSALVADSNGNIYAGGQFTVAGGAPASHIARWNAGTNTWSPLGSGMNITGTVSALAMDPSGNLYAGGNFIAAGGVPAASIAKWNTSTNTWSALGTGIGGGVTGGSYSHVSALAVDGNGNIYAGGVVGQPGGMTWNCVVKLDVSTNSWQALGSGLRCYTYRGSYYVVNALAVNSSGIVYAAGDFGPSYIAQLDPSTNTWQALGGGVNGGVSALALDTSGNVYAGGSFHGAGGAGANNIARWSATNRWSPLGSVDASVDSKVSSLVAVGSRVYAGGYFDKAGNAFVNRVGVLEVSTWSPLGTGVSGGAFVSPYSSPTPMIAALAADGNGNIYAGGNFTRVGGVDANFIAKWNGSNWSPLGAGMPCQGTSCISALLVDGSGNLYAGGSFLDAGGIRANGIALWNASSQTWSALGGGISNPDPYGVHVQALAMDSRGDIYAAGNFSVIGGVSASNIARWDVAARGWQALGTGTNGPIFALAFDTNGKLYAGGAFTTAGGVPANHVARWNVATASWESFGGGMNGPVCALAADSNGNVYAGGSFTSANNIAEWKASTGSWEALGSGTNGTVCAIALQGNNVYAGGEFTTAGGHVSDYVARWAMVPTAFAFSKTCGRNEATAFTTLEWNTHFTGSGSNSLTKIKITSLPAHGTLRLGGSNVTLNQEIAITALALLNFLPDMDWVGTTGFGWNGNDGTAYAPNGATVTLNVKVLHHIQFPFVPR